MIFVPFIFFSIILFGILWNRRRFDLASYITMLYVIISFFAILVDFFRLKSNDVVNHDISFESTFVYCVLLAFFLIPIIRYTKGSTISLAPVENQTILKALAICSFCFFCITLFGSFNSLVGVLTGDMSALRNAVYAGDREKLWFSTLPFGIKQLVIMGNLCFANFWVMQFLGFFSLLVQKIEKKYAIFFFCASLLGPLWGILNVDRSKVTYWIIALIANYFLFDKHMTSKQKKVFVAVSSVCIVFLFIYISMMTDARFEDRSYESGVSGSVGSVISYLGQSFINFSFFYDNFENKEPTLAVIFPFIHKYVFGEFGQGVAIQAHLTALYYFRFGVFYTFLGQILVSAGKLWMFVYSTVLPLIGFSMFRLGGGRDSLIKLYLFMAYSSVMYLGLFGYSYASYSLTFSLVFLFFVFKLMSIRSK